MAEQSNTAGATPTRKARTKREILADLVREVARNPRGRTGRYYDLPSGLVLSVMMEAERRQIESVTALMTELLRAAHTLKGSMTTFVLEDRNDAVPRLDRTAREGELKRDLTKLSREVNEWWRCYGKSS